MRTITMLTAVLLLAGFVTAQATIIDGSVIDNPDRNNDVFEQDGEFVLLDLPSIVGSDVR